MSMRKRGDAGFTLIELLVAMAVFSFMLLIVVVGFMNIVRLHNQALASNMAQDNARTAMNEVVRAIRDSASVQTPAAGATATQLCLSKLGGQFQGYYLQAGVLMRSDNCTTPRVNPQAITGSSVTVKDFTAVNGSTGANIVKPQIDIKITVAGGNAAANTTVAGETKCNNSNADRTFCSVVTLTSGAVPR